MKLLLLPDMLSCLMAFPACSEKEEEGGGNTTSSFQHLEKITYFRDGEYRYDENFTWNGDLLQSYTAENNRWEFNYEDNKLTSIVFYEKGAWDETYYCNYTGNRITGMTETKPEGEGRQYTIGYNSDGQVATVTRVGGNETVNFTWQDGNITQVQRVNSNGTKTWKYTYDNKHSCVTGMSAFFFAQIEESYDGMYRSLCKNNPLTEQTIQTDGTSRTEGYNYTYDDGGYPTTFTDGYMMNYLKYVGKPDPAPAH